MDMIAAAVSIYLVAGRGTEARGTEARGTEARGTEADAVVLVRFGIPLNAYHGSE